MRLRGAHIGWKRRPTLPSTRVENGARYVVYEVGRLGENHAARTTMRGAHRARAELYVLYVACTRPSRPEDTMLKSMQHRRETRGKLSGRR
jgi:hypothetical protein